MRKKYIVIAFAGAVLLSSCDSQKPEFEAIDNRNKVIQCTVSGNPILIKVKQGSLDAELQFAKKKFNANLLEVKDFYQIIMRFDPTIGQLKINRAATELTQVMGSQENIGACTTVLQP
jgi:hypothetical protein